MYNKRTKLFINLSPIGGTEAEGHLGQIATGKLFISAATTPRYRSPVDLSPGGRKEVCWG